MVYSNAISQRAEQKEWTNFGIALLTQCMNLDWQSSFVRRYSIIGFGHNLLA